MRAARLAARLRPTDAVRRLLAVVTRPGGGPPLVGRPPSAATWCEVDADGTVHLHPPKPELGQGAHTVLAQLVLEELHLDGTDVDPARLVVHPPDTDRGFPTGWMTAVGGNTAETMSGPARRAGAALRTARVDAGRTQRRARWLRRRAAPALRPRSEHHLVGTSMPRVDLPAKVDGSAVFATDVRLPRVLVGAVALPPRHGDVLHGVTGLDAARALPGVAAVVVDPATGLVAAAAERRTQAAAALAALGLDWRGGAAVGDGDLRAAVTVPASGERVLHERGDVDAALRRAGGGRRLRLEYRTAMVVPAPLEPPVAVADVPTGGGGRVTVHSSTQNPGLVRAEVARALGRRPRDVRVLVPSVGGSFGRKHGHLGDPAACAARLSAATGRPVRLAWTRRQDLQQGPKRAPSHHVLDAALDEDGTVTALRHRLAVGDGSGGWPATARLARATDVDVLAVFGAQTTYGRIPHTQVAATRVPLPVPLGGMRSIGTFANTFAVESAVDELASAAGADPLAFRLRHLGDDGTGRRLARALSAAADAAGWGTATDPGRARGIACVAYQKTVVAQVVEVSADAGRIVVHRVTAAVEAHPVNPDIARAQSEGGAMMGLSWGLGEQVRMRDGLVLDDDLDSYHLLRAGQAPVVRTVLLDADHWGGGMDEATAAPTAAALANAVHALTGHRLRELPLRLPAVP